MRMSKAAVGGQRLSDSAPQAFVFADMLTSG